MIPYYCGTIGFGLGALCFGGIPQNVCIYQRLKWLGPKNDLNQACHEKVVDICDIEFCPHLNMYMQ